MGLWQKSSSYLNKHKWGYISRHLSISYLNDAKSYLSRRLMSTSYRNDQTNFWAATRRLDPLDILAPGGIWTLKIDLLLRNGITGEFPLLCCLGTSILSSLPTKQYNFHCHVHNISWRKYSTSYRNQHKKTVSGPAA